MAALAVAAPVVVAAGLVDLFSGAAEADCLGAADGRFVASAEALTRWAMRAAPGMRCIYARAACLPRGAAGAVQARALHAAGVLAQLHLRGHGAAAGGRDRLFDYVACRSDLAMVRAVAPMRADALPWDQRLVLDALAMAADAGAPCPSNAALAAALGLSGRALVSAIVTRLRDGGLIRIAAVPAAPWRRVTIMETGAATGLFS